MEGDTEDPRFYKAQTVKRQRNRVDEYKSLKKRCSN